MVAGPKKQVLEVRYPLFDYFFDIRLRLKGHLPQLILLSKAKNLYEEYCELEKHGRDQLKELKITRQWLQNWFKEYRISLKYPNKRFPIPQVERKKRLI